MKLAIVPAVGLAAALVLSGALAPSPARAGDPGTCAVYAGSAVAQQKKNKNMSCGYGGPRWSSNYAGHYAWCLGAPYPAIQAETNARAGLLANCGGGGGPQTKTFVNPKFGGLRLDWCYKWANQCGAYAAKMYCAANNYPLLKGFGKAENIGTFTKTRVMGTGQVCAGPQCDGFTFIKCGK